MSKIQKLLDRIEHNPTNVSFEDLDRLLEAAGFKCRQPRSGSSHYTYIIKNCPEIITVPFHRPVKEFYVKRVVKAIKDYGNMQEKVVEE